LSISKEAQTERAIAGATLAYTLTVENSGHITLTDVVVTDTVDPDWTVIDPEGGLSKEWQVGELAPGATKVLLLQVLVDPDTPEGTIVENQVIASSRETGASASDTRQTSICVARLEMSKHAVADPWYAGWFLGYDIYITNTGCVDLTGLVVTDTVDEEWALIYEDPLPDDRKVKVWDLGDLAIDESVHLELEVTTWTHIPDDTTITNTIAGWANELTSTVTVSETTQILAPPAQTPEPTATPTATPTLEPTLPPRVDLALPLILR